MIWLVGRDLVSEINDAVDSPTAFATFHSVDDVVSATAINAVDGAMFEATAEEDE